jgi:hypothetical protein
MKLKENSKTQSSATKKPRGIESAIDRDKTQPRCKKRKKVRRKKVRKSMAGEVQKDQTKG